MEMICSNCRRPYPEEGAPYKCPTCGGVYDLVSLPRYDPGQVGSDALTRRMWRYRHTFPLPAAAPEVNLGEGSTPVVWAEAFGRRVAFKQEYLNPTGSYKDRGSAVLVSFLKSRGVESAVEDSSGNAGASLAAYAAYAGLQARVFVPEAAAGPKRAQIEAYGAQVVRIMGPRSNASEAVQQAAREGAVYASHAFLPLGLAGYATIAYELVEQMGAAPGTVAPGTVVAPAGQGNLLLALGRGFAALQAAGVIAQAPRLVGVQARACAPLWAVFKYGPSGLGWVTEGDTLAEGVRVKHPARGDAVLEAVAASQGTLLAVDEEEILPGRDELARRGLYVEPTSALVWSGLRQVVEAFPEPFAVVLTGAGLKYYPG